MIMWLTGLFGAWEGITLLRRWFRPLLFVSFMALTPDPDGHKFAACTVLPRRPPKNADAVRCGNVQYAVDPAMLLNTCSRHDGSV